MINTMMEAVGSKKRFFGMPVWVCAIGGWTVKKAHAKKGEEGGLDYVKLMSQIQSKDFYFDASVTQKKLGYDELGFNGGGDVFEGIRQTMRACYPEKFDENGNLKA
jgi:hypothetical protein